MTLNGGILFDKSGTGAEVKDIKRNVVETCEKRLLIQKFVLRHSPFFRVAHLHLLRYFLVHRSKGYK